MAENATSSIDSGIAQGNFSNSGNTDIGGNASTDSVSHESQKLFTQEDLDRVAGKVRREVEQGRSQAGNAARMQPHQQTPTSTFGGIPQVSEEEIQKRIDAAISKHMSTQEQMRAKTEMETRANTIVQNFTSKMMAGRENYSDFDQVIRDMDLAQIPEIVELATNVDNTADVIYDLAKNPHKIATLLNLAGRNQKLAMAEMNKIASSIKVNRDAENIPKARPPLSQIPNSPIGSDSGNMEVEDYRQVDWLRA